MTKKKASTESNSVEKEFDPEEENERTDRKRREQEGKTFSQKGTEKRG